MIQGIDLSTHNKSVSWQTVKDAGVQFAMLRAGFAETVDNMFYTHAPGAASVNIPIGAYWFSYALNAAEARAEAKKCIETIKPYKIEYPIAYDLEKDSTDNMIKAGVTPTRQLVTDIFRAFCEEIEAAGYKAMIYSNPDFLKRLVDTKAIERELWLAAYTGETPDNADKSDLCRMWQYTDSGAVKGIEGKVDQNVWYDKAISSEAEANVYYVAKGDTPWGIAVKLLGSGLRYPEIMKLNGLDVNAQIYAGQELKIPTTAACEYQTHTVVKGDTLWGIAKKYLGSGFKFTEIMKLNGMKSPWIYAGQILKIPN